MPIKTDERDLSGIENPTRLVYKEGMLKVRLVHWHEAEAAERAERLRALDCEVEHEILSGPEGLRRLRNHPPAAVVIDLGRVPSHGRDVGVALRSYKDTRAVPIVFVGGDPAKVERIKAILPDAAYTDWENIGPALKTAVSLPPANPVVPRSRMEAYSGAPLPKKLGIKSGTVASLVGAPEDFEKKLVGLPGGVTIKRGVPASRSQSADLSGKKAGERRLILWFIRTKRDLDRQIKRMAVLTPDGGLWIIWPKKASGLPSDLTQNIVRAQGLAAGIVDYKVCAIDETWSGLLFARRKT
jgi:CheY-like chemotaxis protein